MTATNKICALMAMLCCMLAMPACNSGVVFDEFVELTDDSWQEDSLAIFRAEVNDTTGTYDVSIMVRNTNSYAYQNLWLFVDLISPDGQVRRDTIDCMLAEADGTWRGGGWGSLYTEKCPYMRGVKFGKVGAYTMRVTHGMRDHDLTGIRNIGLIIEQSEEAQ